MGLQTMYPAVNSFAPPAITVQLSPTDTTIVLSDVSQLPPAPNILTISTEDYAELVYYSEITEDGLTGCVRGYDGTTAQLWEVGTIVYRAATAHDHNTFVGNILDLDQRLQVDSLKALLLDVMHPVGSIYMGATADDPATLFGGEWERWGQGRVPAGVNEDDPDFAEAGVSGGAKAVEHAHALTMNSGGNGTSGATNLTLAQLPNATGNVSVHGSATGSMLYTATGVFSGSTSLTGQYKTMASTAGASSLQNIFFSLGGGGGSHIHSTPAHTHTGTIASTSVSTLQPYITCYMWKRIA